MTETERAELALAVARRIGKPEPCISTFAKMIGSDNPLPPKAMNTPLCFYKAQQSSYGYWPFTPTVPGADAWEALEWLIARNAIEDMGVYLRQERETYVCGVLDFWCDGDSLPLAVCRAIVEVGQ